MTDVSKDRSVEDEAVQENLDRLTLKIKALQCFETSVSVCRLATCENPKDLDLRQRYCQNSKFGSSKYVSELST